ncbi:phosphonate C-P lyase system protein PhnG [Alcaligenaceae bacterium C4P045]|nr:phosphonate C-P lyase system protein PhnG [Alcaligenaceae bacterium C4P045]
MTQASPDSLHRAASATAPVSESARRAWMRVLALASPQALNDACIALGELPPRQWLRAPQTGMTMVRARAGGTGEQFNLGEMTMTRCALTLDDGVIGMAYVQGRDARHAEQAAMLDGLLQSPEWHGRIIDTVIEPLTRARQAALAHRSRVAAQTKVDFFTLVRGEN